MARFVPHLILIGLSLFVWLLWQQSVYPLSEPFFSNKGYGMHFVGGIGYAAFQTMVVFLSVPQASFTPRIFVAESIAAIVLLGIVEYMQIYDPTRHFQLEDILAQSIGVVVTLLLLWSLDTGKI